MAAVSRTPAHSFKWDCKQFKPVAANFTVEKCRPAPRCFSARLLKKTWKYFLFLFTWQQLSDNGSYVRVQCSPIIFLPNVARSLRQKTQQVSACVFNPWALKSLNPYKCLSLFTLSDCLQWAFLPWYHAAISVTSFMTRARLVNLEWYLLNRLFYCRSFYDRLHIFFPA